MTEPDNLRDLYRQLPAEEPSATLDDQVRRAVLAELRPPEQRTRWRTWSGWQVPLATAATFVLAVSLLLQHRPLPTDAPRSIPQETAAPMAATAAVAVPDSAEHRAAPATAPPPPPVVAMPPPESPSVTLPVMAATAYPAPAVVPVDDSAATAQGLPPPPAPASLAIKASDFRRVLLDQAPGMPATDFCARLIVLWPADQTAPPCPSSDGVHQWPDPVAVRWLVTAGVVREAAVPPP